MYMAALMFFDKMQRNRTVLTQKSEIPLMYSRVIRRRLKRTRRMDISDAFSLPILRCIARIQSEGEKDIYYWDRPFYGLNIT